MNLQKIITYVVLLVGVVAIILWFLMNGNISDVLVENELTDVKDLPLEVTMPLVSPLYYLVIVVAIIAVVFTLISVVNTLIKSPTNLKKILIGVGAFVAVLAIAYAVSGGDPMKYAYNGVEATEGESQIVGGGLVAFYALIAVAAGTMLFSGIKKLIK